MTEIIERNEKGQILHAHLDPDAARIMQANRYTKAEKAADGAKAILQELGYTDDNPAPELIKNLADIAVSQKTGAVSSIQTLLRIAHGSPDVAVSLQPGDKCPTCHMIYEVDPISVNLLRELVNRLSVRRGMVLVDGHYREREIQSPANPKKRMILVDGKYREKNEEVTNGTN